MKNYRQKKKKKVDYAALQSSFMHIPNIDLATARDLLDTGFNEIHELKGRAPEVLMENIHHIKPETPGDRLYMLRMAVYYAETSDPDPVLMHPLSWKDRKP